MTEFQEEKGSLHPRNRHRARYDFGQLTESCPELGPFVRLTPSGEETLDFFNPAAVKMLNKALLKHFYGIGQWEFPGNYLCPAIPGRADYIHHLADLLGSSNTGSHENEIPPGKNIRCLDIGVGASCVYPLIGNKEYGWSFTGSETDPVSIRSARGIIEANPSLKGLIELRLQDHPRDIFRGIIRENEFFDLTLCNPPFHASPEEATHETIRKLRNFRHKKISRPLLNTAGASHELWCEGGEKRFVGDMIIQSREFSASCFWFTTLISKESSLKSAYKSLAKQEALEIRTIPMSQGNKSSRILAWTFLTREEQEEWIRTRWNQ